MTKINRDEYVNAMVSDIKYLESLGLDGEEILDTMDNLSIYGLYANEYDLMKAMQICGYIVSFW